jgi:hypothetical protein
VYEKNSLWALHARPTARPSIRMFQVEKYEKDTEEIRYSCCAIRDYLQNVLVNILISAVIKWRIRNFVRCCIPVAKVGTTSQAKKWLGLYIYNYRGNHG